MSLDPSRSRSAIHLDKYPLLLSLLWLSSSRDLDLGSAEMSEVSLNLTALDLLRQLLNAHSSVSLLLRILNDELFP